MQSEGYSARSAGTGKVGKSLKILEHVSSCLWVRKGGPLDIFQHPLQCLSVKGYRLYNTAMHKSC